MYSKQGESVDGLILIVMDILSIDQKCQSK